jgi:outer membrane protein assembly factor BamB
MAFSWIAATPVVADQADSLSAESEKMKERATELGRKLGEKLGEALIQKLLDPACDGHDFVATDPNGDVWSVFSIRETKDEGAYLLRKYRGSDGRKLWERKYAESDSSNWRPRAMVVTKDACYLAAAKNGADEKDDWVITRLKSEDGEKVWEKEYDGPGHEYDYPSAMVLTKDGNLTIGGLSSEPEGESSFLVATYSSATGARLWEHRTPNGNCCKPSIEAMIKDSRGDVIITGHIGATAPREGSDMITMKYSANGEQKWVKFYDGGSDGCDSGEAVAVHSDNGIVVLGHSCGESLNGAVFLIKYSGDGELAWKRSFPEEQFPKAHPIAMMISTGGDGYALFDTDGFKHVTLVSFDPGTGEIRWAPSKISIGESPRHGITMLIDATGNPVVLANGRNFDDTGLSHLAKLSRTDGYPIWEAQYFGANRQSYYPLALTADQDGNFLIFGSEYVGLDRHPTLIKYVGTTGKPMWGVR